mgnify:CR=1 FL=1
MTKKLMVVPEEVRKETVIELGSIRVNAYNSCLLYTSDAADDLLCVDLGGRRIIKKKKHKINKKNKTHKLKT